MKHIFKKSILFSTVLTLLLGCLILVSPVRIAAAPKDNASKSGTTAQDASQKAITANDYCSSYEDSSVRSACKVGFNAGTANKSEESACQDLRGNDLTACQYGWGYAKHTDPAIKCDGEQCDLVAKYVNPTVELLSISFGLIATISIILGAIQYSASEGDPQKSAAAKNRITNTIIAIVAFLLLFAFLQFLVPGGIFNRSI